jgi:hypothetical protein
MGNSAAQTKLFLDSVDPRIKSKILSNIADNYGITKEEAFEEITDEDAEDLLEYITGSLVMDINKLIVSYRLIKKTKQ